MFDRCWLAAAATTIMLAAGVPVHAQTDAAPAAQPRPPRIETSVLANQPFLSNPKLSPDGTQIVARMNVAGKDCIGVSRSARTIPGSWTWGTNTISTGIAGPETARS
ncbi:MAG: hypothetical protein E2586_16135 [Novosphingobium sp.]|uniref:hypothetical protein n=1 Tax=Novosphingobium sp. TaxID=1874826 RepID=UPI0012C92536|nr:hypothetical protein [Novosphingobium sp.]MPS70009.1 hypothetical protein [Novosphingobium sp.]